MSSSRLKKTIKKAYKQIGNVSSSVFSPIIYRFHLSAESIKLGTTKPQVFAYRLVGGKVARFLPLFKDLDGNLHKSGMKANFRAYVSTLILTILVLCPIVFFLVTVPLNMVFDLSLYSSLLFGVGTTLLAGASIVMGFYVYPIYRADNLKRTIDDNLHFTAGYMAILAGAGVPPGEIFRSLSKIDASLAISSEAKTIVRDVELFGFDIISALESTTDRTPSIRFGEFLQGFIATVNSGGSLVEYLRNRSLQYMKLKRIALRRFSDVLSVLAEFYVAILVAGSLIFVVMLVVMAMLGGGGSGLLNPRLLLYLLTYLGIPIGSVLFLVVLDIATPKR